MGIGKAWGILFGSGDSTKKTLKAMLFSIIPIINVISHGYAVELMGNAARGKEEMPAWGSGWDLFVKGFSASMLYFAYLVIPFFLRMAINLFTESDLLSFLAYLLYLVFLFSVPMSVAFYSATDKWGEAFSFSSSMSRIKPVFKKYLGAFVLNTIFLLIAEIIVEVIILTVGRVPLLRWTLTSLLNFFVLITFYYVYGSIYYLIPGNQNSEADTADTAATAG
ncbi:MAG: DUF4013 domain-containing protein [Firmicutes bacterium]|nr:DUF4013 domain-containing protein [Bacillota bacterium]